MQIAFSICNAIKFKLMGQNLKLVNKNLTMPWWYLQFISFHYYHSIPQNATISKCSQVCKIQSCRSRSHKFNIFHNLRECRSIQNHNSRYILWHKRKLKIIRCEINKFNLLCGLGSFNVAPKWHCSSIKWVDLMVLSFSIRGCII